MNKPVLEFMGYRYTFDDYDKFCWAVVATQQHTNPKVLATTAISVEKIGERETVDCRVDAEGGTISPTFTKLVNCSSGVLKYFQPLKGQKVRVTIEVTEEDKVRSES